MTQPECSHPSCHNHATMTYEDIEYCAQHHADALALLGPEFDEDEDEDDD